MNRPLELGSPGDMRERLNGLVLGGHKVAAFGLVQEYLDEGEAIETVGEELDLVDSAGGRVATVRITEVRELDFGAADWGLVEAEGEGDVAFTPTQAGAYRAEVRLTPRHLRGYLSTYEALADREYPWIYSNAIYVVE